MTVLPSFSLEEHWSELQIRPSTSNHAVQWNPPFIDNKQWQEILLATLLAVLPCYRQSQRSKYKENVVYRRNVDRNSRFVYDMQAINYSNAKCLDMNTIHGTWLEDHRQLPNISRHERQLKFCRFVYLKLTSHSKVIGHCCVLGDWDIIAHAITALYEPNEIWKTLLSFRI